VGPTTSRDLRCPTCGAHARLDAEWCTLCYADLRPPAPEPEPAAPLDAEPAAPLDAEPGLTPSASDEASAAPSVPTGKHARRAASTTGEPGDDPRLAGVDVDVMLSRLAAETPPALGPLAGRLDSKASRVAAVSAGVAVVGLVLLLVMTVLGSLL
jgi:hypothetical protein